MIVRDAASDCTNRGYLLNAKMHFAVPDDLGSLHDLDE